MKKHIFKTIILVSLCFSILRYSGCVEARAAENDRNVATIGQTAEIKDERDTIVGMVLTILNEPLIGVGEGINVARFEKVAQWRTELLGKGAPRSIAFGLTLQDLLNTTVMTAAAKSSADGTFMTNRSQWKSLQRASQFGDKELRSIINSLNRGLARNLQEYVTSNTDLAAGGVVKEITRLAKDIPTVASRWRAWEKYTEDRLVTSEAGANLDNVSDFVTTRALRVAQLTIYRDLYLEALGGSTNSWPHDISNDIEKVLPKHHRRVDNESGYNAKLVLGDAQQMIMPSEEFYTQWTIVRFHPFVMRDDLPTNLRTQISSYFDFGFMLPPQQ